MSYSDKHYRLNVELDINIQLYPISSNDSFLIRLVNCNHVKNVYSPEEVSRPSERDSYEYVMYGQVFEIEEKGS